MLTPGTDRSADWTGILTKKSECDFQNLIDTDKELTSTSLLYDYNNPWPSALIFLIRSKGLFPKQENNDKFSNI